MKILVVAAGFPPGIKYGGLATSRVNFVMGLESSHDISVVAPNHDFREQEPYAGISDGWTPFGKRSKVRYISNRTFSLRFFSACLDEIRPDLVYLSGTITSYFQYNRPVIRAAKAKNIPVLITPDGDVCRTALKHRWPKKAAAVLLCRLLAAFRDASFQVTCEEERENLIRFLRIRPERITQVPNMPTVMEEKRTAQKVSDRLRVVYCARLHRNKRPDLAIRAVKLCDAGVSLDLYGQIEDGAYWDHCRELIGADTHRIRYCGLLPADKARTICRDYDCSILPTRSENYCYSIEESLRCGCPAVISRGTTPWDGIDGVCGMTIPAEDAQAYADALTKLQRTDAAAYARLSNQAQAFAAERSGLTDITQRYHALLQHVCASGKTPDGIQDNGDRNL